MKQILMWIREQSGIDGLGDLFSKPDDNPITDDDRRYLDEFKKKKHQFHGEQIQQIIAQYKDLLASEEERKNRIESKAVALLGYIGVSITIILGLLPFLGFESIYLTSIFGLATLHFLLSAILSTKALQIGRQNFAFVDVADLWDFGRKNAKDDMVFREHAWSLLFVYLRNTHLINYKAGLVSFAQIWFRNAIIFLIVGLFMILFVIPPQDSENEPPFARIEVVFPTAENSGISTAVPPVMTPFSEPEMKTLTPSEGTESVWD